MLIKHAIHWTDVTLIWLHRHVFSLLQFCFCNENVCRVSEKLIPVTVTRSAAVESVHFNVDQKEHPPIQFSVSDESDTSASRACLLRTFQCKH